MAMLRAMVAVAMFANAVGAQTASLAPHSVGLSDEGRWLAYGRTARGNDTVALIVRGMRDTTSSRIAGIEYGSPNYGPRPVWSHDDRYLAYYGVTHGVLTLEVWDRVQRRNLPGASIPVTISGVASYQAPQWTADGRYVLVIADTGKPRRIFEEQESNPAVAQLRTELVGQRRAPAGVTVLTTPALPPALTAELGGTAVTRTGGGRAEVRRIVVFDVVTKKARAVTTGIDVVAIQTALQGATTIVGARNAKDNLDLFELADIGRSPRLRPLVANVPTWQYLNFSVSPSGKSIALLEYGTGDVKVLDVASASVRVLTSVVPSRSADSTDAETRRLLGRYDLPLYLGKFGDGNFDGPVWTPDESAIVVTRIVPRRSVTIPRRVELWRVATASGAAQRLVQDTTISVSEWASCQGRPYIPCIALDAGEVVARLRANESSDSARYSAINTTTGAVRALRVARTAGSASDGELAVAAVAGDLVAVEEEPERPPEVWTIAHDGEARSLRLLNPDAHGDFGSVRRVQWLTSNGDSMFAQLRLPPGTRVGEKLPVILDIYPGRRGLGGALRFDGGRIDPLRVRGHFALLRPDLPVTFGSGTVCADFTRIALDALGGAAATGLIDPQRAGLMGISNGGYAVNCIVTHTDRFRAAISEAGPSDITSARTLGGSGQTIITGKWPWESPERMVAESPVYFIDKVTTPLMLVAGKRDMGNALQEYEMFFGLQAIGKPAALVSFDDAGHGDYDRFPEFWDRVLAWFGTYLK